MFGKKLFIFFVLLLFISHISFISAVEDNQTEAIIIKDQYMFSDNDASEDDFLGEINDLDEDTIIDFNQGDKIPITIDSPVEGNLTVLIDNEFYGSWNFSKNKTIFIPTYNSNSFYDSSIKNIDVGNHEFSLIFNLNSYNNCVPEVYEKDSNLKFIFHKFTDDILTQKYTYTHSSSLTIFEKRKTIDISLLPYYYVDSFPIYFAGVGLDITFDNINFKDKNKHSFGFILSDSTGRIVFKKNMNVSDSFNIREFVQPWSNESSGIDCEFWYDFPMLGHDILLEIGVCNLTVVNFIDGTNDSILINISKFFNYYEKIDCIIHDSDVTFYFYQFFPKVFISVDNNGKYISPKEDKWNVTFVNLNPGVHTMNLYYLKTDYSKELLNKLIFKINNQVDDFHNSIVDISPINNFSFCMFPDLLLIGNGGFLLGNANEGIVDFQDIMIVDDSSSSNNESNLDGESISAWGDSGDVGTVGGSSGSSNTKYYEISKSHPKNDLLSQVGMLILSCTFFMIGYNRFDKH